MLSHNERIAMVHLLLNLSELKKDMQGCMDSLTNNPNDEQLEAHLIAANNHYENSINIVTTFISKNKTKIEKETTSYR